MIKELLAYQEKDKERLTLLLSVENGRVKRELDLATKLMNDAKSNLLSLENDAKVVTASLESSIKNLKETFTRIDQFKGESAETQSTIEYLETLLKKVSGYESQLEEISKRIVTKSAAYRDNIAAAGRGQNTVKAYTPEYQKQCDAIAPKLAKTEAELAKLGSAVDKIVLEKYKKRRATDKSGKITDIVVAISANRCGGCFHEMPTLLVHKIKTDGYIICENCGKIIY